MAPRLASRLTVRWARRSSLRLTCIGAGLILLAGAPAMAQTPPAKNPDQNAPRHFDSSKDKGKTLSEHLEKSDGIIKPPANVDPDIHEQAPATGDQGMVVHPNQGGAAPTDKAPANKATPK